MGENRKKIKIQEEDGTRTEWEEDGG